MSYLEKSTFWKRSIDWLLQLTVIPRIILLMYILNNQDSNAQFFFIISCVVSLDHSVSRMSKIKGVIHLDKFLLHPTTIQPNRTRTHLSPFANNALLSSSMMSKSCFCFCKTQQIITFHQFDRLWDSYKTPVDTVNV